MGETGQNNGGRVRLQGIANLQKGGKARTKVGQKIAAQVLHWLQRKSLCERSLSGGPLASGLVTFVATKVTALPRQLSGPVLSIAHKIVKWK